MRSLLVKRSTICRDGIGSPVVEHADDKSSFRGFEKEDLEFCQHQTLMDTSTWFRISPLFHLYSWYVLS